MRGGPRCLRAGRRVTPRKCLTRRRRRLAGRQAKLRVLKRCIWVDKFKTPLDDADWDIELTRRLLAELCQMAA